MDWHIVAPNNTHQHSKTAIYGVPPVKVFYGQKWILCVICRYSFKLHLKMFAPCPKLSTIWAILPIIYLFQYCYVQIDVWQSIHNMRKISTLSVKFCFLHEVFIFLFPDFYLALANWPFDFWSLSLSIEFL